MEKTDYIQSCSDPRNATTTGWSSMTGGLLSAQNIHVVNITKTFGPGAPQPGLAHVVSLDVDYFVILPETDFVSEKVDLVRAAMSSGLPRATSFAMELVIILNGELVGSSMLSSVLEYVFHAEVLGAAQMLVKDIPIDMDPFGGDESTFAPANATSEEDALITSELLVTISCSAAVAGCAAGLMEVEQGSNGTRAALWVAVKRSIAIAASNATATEGARGIVEEQVMIDWMQEAPSGGLMPGMGWAWGMGGMMSGNMGGGSGAGMGMMPGNGSMPGMGMIMPGMSNGTTPVWYPSNGTNATQPVWYTTVPPYYPSNGTNGTQPPPVWYTTVPPDYSSLGYNATGSPWWNATAPPPWYTMYPPSPGYNATGPPWWNGTAPPPWYTMYGLDDDDNNATGPPWWNGTAPPPWYTMYLPSPGYNATVPPWYTSGMKPHSSCPDVEHDDCCSCMSNKMQYGDWDSNHCCGACTNICAPPGYNGTGPLWWNGTAPPYTMYPPGPLTFNGTIYRAMYVKYTIALKQYLPSDVDVYRRASSMGYPMAAVFQERFVLTLQTEVKRDFMLTLLETQILGAVVTQTAVVMQGGGGLITTMPPATTALPWWQWNVTTGAPPGPPSMPAGVPEWWPAGLGVPPPGEKVSLIISAVSLSLEMFSSSLLNETFLSSSAFRSEFDLALRKGLAGALVSRQNLTAADGGPLSPMHLVVAVNKTEDEGNSTRLRKLDTPDEGTASSILRSLLGQATEFHEVMVQYIVILPANEFSDTMVDVLEHASTAGHSRASIFVEELQSHVSAHIAASTLLNTVIKTTAGALVMGPAMRME